MLRKLILSAVLATGTLTGIAAIPTAADAQPPIGFDHRQRDRDHRDRHHRERFEVTYFDCGRWECAGTFRDRDDAERVAHRLRHRGFEVRIRCD